MLFCFLLSFFVSINQNYLFYVRWESGTTKKSFFQAPGLKSFGFKKLTTQPFGNENIFFFQIKISHLQSQPLHTCIPKSTISQPTDDIKPIFPIEEFEPRTNQVHKF